MRAPRIFTPQRVLCLPFEDMLIFKDPDPKQPGKIARAAIGPMWNLLMDRVKPKWDPIADAFIAAQKKGDETTKNQTASALWALAAQTLKEWDTELGTDAGEIRAAAKKIGGTKRLEDLREMMAILAIADIVESLKEKLPRKPILNFTPEHVTIVKRHYDMVGDQAADHEVYLLLALMGRLLQPFPILKVFRALSRKLDDTLTSSTDLGIAGNIVIEALERDADAVAEAADAPNATETDVIAKAKRLEARQAGIKPKASRMAEQIGLQSACQSKVNQLRKDLEQYAAKIIEKLPKVGPDNKPEASAHLATTVRLVELITNSDTADLLRRRGNAALTGKTLN